MLSELTTHESFRDFADPVVPELQRRGVYKKEYCPGTLREKLCGRGAHLPEEHRGAFFRIRQEQGALT
jgi:long-chain alkane monooxygenase